MNPPEIHRSSFIVHRCLLAFIFASAANAQTFQLFGYLTGHSAYVKAPPSWATGGFGRFDAGADTAGDHATRSSAVAQVGAEWSPTTWLTAHGQVLARSEPSGTKGRRFGVVEAYADLHGEKWRLRGGYFFLGTSRENVDPLWTSPYTITYSALNTWIGQEVRPVGVDLQYSPSFYVTLGATAFRDNDTMGTLPAGRGWTFGSRLTVYDEELAVPDGTTKPFTRDLDDKWGHSERVRVQIPERAMLQVTHLDNRSELGERRGLDPWRTRFNIVGAQVGTTGPWTLAGEWMSGDTTIGFRRGTFTLDFETAYLLGSYKHEHDRLSVRVERFSTSVNEDGKAWTVAWFRERNANLRAGIEYVRVSGDRPDATGFGVIQTGGSMVTIELRYKF